MAGTVTSLYLDDASIRLAVTRGRRIIKLVSIPLEQSLADIDNDEKEKEIAGKIKDLFESNKIKERKVILGISGQHCLTRPAILPALPKAMQQEAVIREAKRVLPIPPEQLYLSWQSIGNDEDKLTVFMVGIPRVLADTIIRIIQYAGLKPYMMDLKPLAIARLATEPTCIIVDVQQYEFDLVILSEGIPHPVRIVPFAEADILLEDKVNIISEELERTVEFFNSNNPAKKLSGETRIFFSGEIIDEPDICAEIAERTGFQYTQLVSPFKNLKNIKPTYYMVNLGLALKGHWYEQSALLPDFNTLPEPYLPQKVSKKKLVYVAAGGAVIAVLFLMVMGIQQAGKDLNDMKNQLADNELLYEKKLQEKSELNLVISNLENEIGTLETSINGMQNVLDMVNLEGEAIDADLNAARIKLVQGSGIGGIDRVQGSFGLSGIAESENEVIEYARKLMETGRFIEITIQKIEFNVEDGLCQFSLRLRLPEA